MRQLTDLKIRYIIKTLLKKTVRETTDEPDKTLNMSSIHKMHTVYDPNDIPEPTTKDTNIHNTRTGNVGMPGVDKGTGYQTAGVQVPPNTNKQFTSDFEYQGVADGDVGKGGGEGYLVTNYEAKMSVGSFWQIMNMLELRTALMINPRVTMMLIMLN